jgi:hypothetical protein
MGYDVLGKALRNFQKMVKLAALVARSARTAFF